MTVANFLMILGGLIALLSAMVGAWWRERRAWNDGFCPKTGEPWEYYATDSQGGRGYKSSEGGVWISYPFITGDK